MYPIHVSMMSKYIVIALQSRMPDQEGNYVCAFIVKRFFFLFLIIQMRTLKVDNAFEYFTPTIVWK